MSQDTEDVCQVPGSTSEPIHASHCPAASLTTGTRSARNDAMAHAALEGARAMLAAHKSILNKRYY